MKFIACWVSNDSSLFFQALKHDRDNRTEPPLTPTALTRRRKSHPVDIYEPEDALAHRTHRRNRAAEKAGCPLCQLHHVYDDGGLLLYEDKEGE